VRSRRRSPGALRERDITPAERKAELRQYANELKARIAREDAANQKREPATKRETPPEVLEANAKLAAARARRAERELTAGMTVTEYTEYLNSKAERKAQRKRQLEALRGRP
jgi:hypothetical protein